MPINLINDDLELPLSYLCLLLISRNFFVVVWNLSFKKKKRYEKRKSDNMLYLMLNLRFKRFKNLCLVYSFIGCEKE